MRKFSPILIAMAVFAVMAGCSDNSTDLVSPSNPSPILSYMPIESGYSAYYNVSHSDGRSEVVRYSVGAPMQVGSDMAREWVYNSTTGEEKVSFIEAKNDCILVFDPSTSATEKILQLPLEPGATWQRYSGSSENLGGSGGTGGTFEYQFTNGDTSIITGVNGGNTGQNDKGLTNDEALGSFPTDGSSEMLVEEIGSLELSSGAVYSDAIRISNAGTSGRNNYYWYVQGIGLVKYAINAQGPDDGSGQMVGELLSFSR